MKPEPHLPIKAIQTRKPPVPTMDVEGSVISAAAGIVIHVLLALLFLFSTVANVLVIVIFYRRPALRTLSNR